MPPRYHPKTSSKKSLDNLQYKRYAYVVNLQCKSTGMEEIFMRWEGCIPRGLPIWVVMLVVLFGGVVLIYLLVCVFLAGFLWFDPVVF